MNQLSSFINSVLNKVLSTEKDYLNRARIKILFTILIFSLVKTMLVLPFLIWKQPDTFQLVRAVGLLFVYAGLLKLLLTHKSYIPVISHLMACMGLFLIWSTIFVSAQKINIITLQFIFMLIISSFYLLKKRYSLLYSFLSILPVLAHLLLPREALAVVTKAPNELVSPAFEILIVLNFISIVVVHYLFSSAFSATIAAKETLNKHLQLAVKDANQAAETKSDFLSTMSHELRTPLNSVLGISELLLKDAYNEEQAENLQILKFSAQNLHSLINDILDYNKLESGKLELEAITVNLAEILRSVGSGLSFQAKQKNIDFVLDIDEQVNSKHVITDPTRFTQIIYNLAGNAIKFTEAGSVTIRLQVLDCDNEILKSRIEINDTGIGISRAQQSVIFEPFTQASSSTTRRFGGTGLGLAIVKQLLVMFSSSIQVESEPGIGSTFYFDLSFRLDNQTVKAQYEDIEAPHDLSRLRVLVAEDNAMNRLLLSKILSKWNNTPVFAANGREAVDELAINNYDVILMDIHMPVLNGYEATQIIRNMKDPVKSKIPVIALTAAVDNNLYEKITEAGMNDFVLKPFKLEDLYNKLDALALNNISELVL